jgi:hypothetical protein
VPAATLTGLALSLQGFQKKTLAYKQRGPVSSTDLFQPENEHAVPITNLPKINHHTSTFCLKNIDRFG